MSVSKPKNSPYYHYDFQINGRQFRGSTQVTSKTEARKVEASIRAERQKELKLLAAAGNAPLKIDQAFARYWTESGQFRANAPDIFSYMAQLQDWFTSERITLLTEVTDAVMAKMVTWRRAQYRWGKKKHGHLTPAQVNRTGVHIMRRVMLQARDIWKLPLVDMPRWGSHLLKEPEERVRTLAPEEHKALHAALNPDYEQLRLFSLASGLRQQESLLRWSNIDWSSMKLSVAGKGGRTMRRPITREMEKILRSREGHDKEFVFTYVAQRKPHRGKRCPIVVEGLKSHWERAVKRAGVKGYRWHDNRHTFATELLRSSGNLKLVQLALNHSRVETTAKYAHVLDDELRDAMEVASEKTQRRLPSLSPLNEGEKQSKSIQNKGK